jgi:hypothetical protein
MWTSEEGGTAVAHTDATLAFRDRGAFEQRATHAVARGARTVVVDMAGAGPVDASDLRELVLLASRLRYVGAVVCLANASLDLRALLATSPLGTFLPTRAD